MIVYRISHALFSSDISGEGARMYGGRWNTPGLAMLYCSEHISLCLLEMLVHSRGRLLEADYELLSIQIPEHSPSMVLGRLKQHWEADTGYSRYIGDAFLRSNQHLYMKVPSAVVQQEHNFIVNSRHPDFKKIKIVNTQPFTPDERLLTIK